MVRIKLLHHHHHLLFAWHSIQLLLQEVVDLVEVKITIAVCVW